MTATEQEGWPRCDGDLSAWLAAASDPMLHAWMCRCVEHAIEICRPLYQAAGYKFLPDPTPIEVHVELGRQRPLHDGPGQPLEQPLGSEERILSSRPLQELVQQFRSDGRHRFGLQ